MDAIFATYIRSNQISTFRLSVLARARITGKSCVAETPNLEGQRVPFSGQVLFILFTTMVEVRDQ